MYVPEYLIDTMEAADQHANGQPEDAPRKAHEHETHLLFVVRHRMKFKVVRNPRMHCLGRVYLFLCLLLALW
jgi:hypothetical protein